MGKIDQAISENYQKSLNIGDLERAKRAIRLARVLKNLVEYEGFIDYEGPSSAKRENYGNIFRPVAYKYYPETETVVFFKSTISLTKTENKLFSLFSQHETTVEKVDVIKNATIKNYVWPKMNVTDNAVRILVKRLRKKIEPEPVEPQIILNYNKKGYIFLANKA